MSVEEQNPEMPGRVRAAFSSTWHWIRRIWDRVRIVWYWLVDTFFVAAAPLLFIFAAVLLLIWGWTSIVWTADSELRNRQTFFEGENGRLDIEAPAMVLADAPPQELRFIWQPPAEMTRTLTITTGLPAGLALTEQPYLQEVAVPLSPDRQEITRPLTVAMKLESSRQLTGWRHRAQPLSFAYPKDFSESSDRLEVRVEGERAFVFRRFVNSAVNQESPLILLAVALISAAGFIYREHLKEQRAERLAVQRRRHLLDEAEMQFQTFEQQIIAGNLDAARRTYSELQALGRQLDVYAYSSEDSA